MSKKIKKISKKIIPEDFSSAFEAKSWWLDRRWELLEMAKMNLPVLLINEESINQQAFNLLNIANISKVYTDLALNSNARMLTRLAVLNVGFYSSDEDKKRNKINVPPPNDNDEILYNVSSGKDEYDLSGGGKFAVDYAKYAELNSFQIGTTELLPMMKLDLETEVSIHKQLAEITEFLSMTYKKESFQKNILVEIVNMPFHDGWISTFEDRLYDLTYDFPELQISILCPEYLLATSAILLAQIKSVENIDGKTVYSLDLASSVASIVANENKNIHNMSKPDDSGTVPAQIKSAETVITESVDFKAEQGDIILFDNCGCLETELGLQKIPSGYLKSRRVCTVCNL